MVVSEQVCVRAGLQEKQCQFGVILIPCHQPVGLDVTLPNSLQLARQLVRAILCGQRAVGSKKPHRFVDEFHVESALHTEAELLFETVRDSNSVRHDLQSHFLEKLIDRVVGCQPAVFRVIESLLNVPHGSVVHILASFGVVDARLLLCRLLHLYLSHAHKHLAGLLHLINKVLIRNL